MGKLMVGAGSALMVLFLAVAGLMMAPVRTCSVAWVDRDNKPIRGLYNSCPAELRTRELGGQDYAQVGTGVYRVERVVQRQRGGSLRPHVSELLLFIRDIDGPAELEKMQAYHNDNSYLSDGTHQFLRGRSLSLTPPLDFARLKPVPPETSMSLAPYLTDGTWVVYGHELVRGAHAATFRQVPVLRQDGLPMRSTGAQVLAVDRQAVYHGANRLEGADPATLGVIAYWFRSDAPPGVATVEPEGWIAFDRSQAWRVGWTEIERFDATQAQLAALRGDLQRARAAAAIGW